MAWLFLTLTRSPRVNISTPWPENPSSVGRRVVERVRPGGCFDDTTFGDHSYVVDNSPDESHMGRDDGRIPVSLTSIVYSLKQRTAAR
ncbi:MAG: hypothetical protein RBS84_04135 [Kiritimatiellia bacterium]|nr:hypothetical protein [Kiritimatiellia bacterium]